MSQTKRDAHGDAAQQSTPGKKSKAGDLTGVVNFVLFGLGRAGTIHANNLLRHPLAKVLYIVELDTAKAQQFVEEQDKLRGECAACTLPCECP
jgi:hypothetical protein